MKLKILVAATEQAIRDTLKAMLEGEGYQVVCAADGLVAQQVVSLEAFDIVIADINMPGEKAGGIDLLKFVNRTKQIPVILMTGLTEIDETQEASKLGAKSFLAKPFKKEDMLAALKNSVEAGDPEITKQKSDQLYCRLSLEDFVSGRFIPFDLFVRLGDEKYVKIAHQGEDLSTDRIRAYRARGIGFLYVTKENFHGYLRQNLAMLSAVKKAPNISTKKKLAFLKHTGDLILESVFKNDISSAAVDDARYIVENTVSLLCEEKETFDLLSMLSGHGDYLYSHSLGVSMFTALLAREVGWTSPATIYRLSLAGLLHDVGLKDVDRLILDKPRSQMTQDALIIFESHTTQGMEILSKLQTVPSDIMQIALQHHERDHGGGYPIGLTKNHIQPLARLLAVADEFCNLAIKNPNSPGMPFAAAYDRLMISNGSVLDKTYLAALKSVVDRLTRTEATTKAAG